MRMIVKGEYSGRVRDAFKIKGWDAWSCDYMDSEAPGNHIQGDFMLVDDSKYDLGIFHPTCTYLCNSGVRWLYNPDKSINKERWEKMEQAADQFKLLLNSAIPLTCIENPIMHKHAMRIIGVKPSQIIQPYQFGHTTSKATCLWLKGLPNLIPTHTIPKEQRTFDIHLASPSINRWRERSRTFTGIANAMADQYSNFLNNQQ